MKHNCGQHRSIYGIQIAFKSSYGLLFFYFILSSGRIKAVKIFYRPRIQIVNREEFAGWLLSRTLITLWCLSFYSRCRPAYRVRTKSAGARPPPSPSRRRPKVVGGGSRVATNAKTVFNVGPYFYFFFLFSIFQSINVTV